MQAGEVALASLHVQDLGWEEGSRSTAPSSPPWVERGIHRDGGERVRVRCVEARV